MPAGATGTFDRSSTAKGPTFAASQLATKMVSIYLVSDLAADGATNSGQVSYIWTNPNCPTSKSDSGGIVVADCDTSKITNYFEFARPTAEVNTDLNSQQIPVTVGTYGYIRMQVCDNQHAETNIKFTSTTASLTTAFEGRTGNCVLNPVKIDPPLVVAKGDTVVLTLKYDLTQALADYCYDVTAGRTICDGTNPVASGCTFNSDKSKELCFRDLSLVPSVTK